MKLRDGFSTSRRSRNFSSVTLGPSTSIKTPCAELLTQPASCSPVARRKTNGRKPTPCTAPRTTSFSRSRSGAAGFISLLDLEAFEDHVGGVHCLEVQRIAFGANIRQVVRLELVRAFRTLHERRNLRERERGAFDKGALFFHNLKTELHMFGAVAGKRIETDFDKVDAPGPLRGSLFFNRVNDGPDEMDFVHKLSFKSLPLCQAPVNARRREVLSQFQFGVPRLRGFWPPEGGTPNKKALPSGNAWSTLRPSCPARISMTVGARSAGSSWRTWTSVAASTAASTKTTARAEEIGSASSGVSWWRTRETTPGRASSATAAATFAPTPSSLRKVLP